MPSTKANNFNVDAVIMWVDGNDELWQQKLNKYAESEIDFNSKEESVRYNSIGEINIAIKSLIKYAQFLNTIFLVTDNQIPENFEELKKLGSQKGITLKLVDHKLIFKGFQQYLPSFNSRSIASMLYRIPGLSEHFIIFNDDTFLMRRTSVNDYFENGLPILRGKWKKFYEDQHLRKCYYRMLSFLGRNNTKKKAGFKEAMQKSAKLAGAEKYLRRFHNPIPMRKSTIESFFKTNQELLETNIKFRFRNNNQFLVESLANHLEIANETYSYKSDTKLTYFRSYKSLKQVRKRLRQFLNNDNDVFMTFQSLELADDNIIRYILQWINKRLDSSMDEIQDTVDILKEGNILLYPTDTVWGLGCDATNEIAVSEIYEVKQRVETKSLIILVDSLEMLRDYIENVPAKALEIIESSEKPTTVIYKNPKGLAKNVVAQDNTIAIRLVQDEFCQSLIKQFGKPIVSTSANISGNPTPMSFNEIEKSILDSVDYVVNLRKNEIASKSSRIVKILDNGVVEVLRD